MLVFYRHLKDNEVMPKIISFLFMWTDRDNPKPPAMLARTI